MTGVQTCALPIYCNVFSVGINFDKDGYNEIKFDENKIGVVNGKHLYLDKGDYVYIILAKITKEQYMLMSGVPMTYKTKYFDILLNTMEIPLKNSSSILPSTINYSFENELEKLKNKS